MAASTTKIERGEGKAEEVARYPVISLEVEEYTGRSDIGIRKFVFGSERNRILLRTGGGFVRTESVLQKK